MRYYKIYVDNTKDLYTYLDENDQYEIGERVEISFRNKIKSGLIMLEDTMEDRSFKVLPILKRVENSLKLEKSFIKLLLWIKKYYMSSYDQVITAAIPSDLGVKYEERYLITDDLKIQNLNYLSSEVKEFLLKKFEVGKYVLTKKFPKELIEKMVEKTILVKKDKNLKFNFTYSHLEDMSKEEIEVGNYFSERLIISKNSLENNVEKESIKKLVEDQILIYEKVLKEKKEKISSKIESNVNQEDKKLNEEQQKAFQDISLSEKRYFLLKGITGSGKTEVYIALIKEAFKRGKGSIFLVPEISLTPQMIERFQGEFKENIAILHSKLTTKERTQEWYDIYSGEKKIVLGARSAIFAPIKDLEYIILDEEHENTYKQDNNPRYNAKQVAIKRVELEGGKVVLGSATPSIESFYYSQTGIFELIELNKRYNNAILPEIEIVDMKQEESIYFSKKLLENIRMTLLKGEQVLLLLNRKGYSTYIQCTDCGHVEECDHCSIKYSYYASQGILKCNYCGKIKRYTGSCSKCGSRNLIHSGKGVERVEEEIKKIFDVRVIRVDSENSKDRDFYEKMYYDFLNKKYDIMVGTQMISKGLHFPDVTLVGVINADTILNFPDFRAGEKTFQLVTQVAGRAGRGNKKGKVIVQTYQPENLVFSKVKESDYLGFYKKEIANREILEYPPFSKTINIGLSSNNEKQLQEFVKEFYSDIKDSSVELYGPMKSLVYKVKDRFRYNIFIKGERKKINIFKKNLKLKLTKYEKNDKIRIVVDVDPINLI